MKKNYFILFITTSIILQSCATIISGKTQSITFNSEPPGATVSVDGKEIGKTPLVTEVFRKSELIKFNLTGYQDYQYTIKKCSNGWVWGNFVTLPLLGFGPLIGSIIDYNNGSGYKIKKLINPQGQMVEIDDIIFIELKKTSEN